MLLLLQLAMLDMVKEEMIVSMWKTKMLDHADDDGCSLGVGCGYEMSPQTSIISRMMMAALLMAVFMAVILLTV